MANKPPTAAFRAHLGAGTAPLPVTFTDQDSDGEREGSHLRRRAMIRMATRICWSGLFGDARPRSGSVSDDLELSLAIDPRQELVDPPKHRVLE